LDDGAGNVIDAIVRLSALLDSGTFNAAFNPHSTMETRLLFLITLLFAPVASVKIVHASTIIVLNTNDGGPDSLRARNIVRQTHDSYAPTHAMQPTGL
jgi:hypothetical protein